MHIYNYVMQIYIKYSKYYLADEINFYLNLTSICKNIKMHKNPQCI